MERRQADPRVAAVVLAAGMATRMGRVKQVLPINGEPMVRRAVRTCLVAGLAPVWVITGHAAAEVEAALTGMPNTVRCVFNPDYAAGQATSLKAGVRAAVAAQPGETVARTGTGAETGGGSGDTGEVGAGSAQDIEGLAVVLADQPFVRAETLRHLVTLAFEPGALGAAVSYGPRRPGAPCVLRRALWPRVLGITGDRGARAVLLSVGDAVRILTVPLEELRDIDGPQDVPRPVRG